MNVEWYPGHMTKARRQMKADLTLIDLIIEIRDARIPESSRNPDLTSMGAGKLRLVVLNKADLADPEVTACWLRALSTEGQTAVSIDSHSPKSRKELFNAVEKAAAPRRERDRKRGLKNRAIKAMVVGIPNVGKSTVINRLTGRSIAKTGDRPGVTRGKQWIHTASAVDLLDTPGILWPKFDSEEVGIHLALCRAISEERIDREELAADLLSFLRGSYPGIVSDVYGCNDAVEGDSLLEEAGKHLNLLLPGGIPDTRRTAERILADFRSGKLGRISLEEPEEQAKE